MGFIFENIRIGPDDFEKLKPVRSGLMTNQIKGKLPLKNMSLIFLNAQAKNKTNLNLK
jgi:hypothetical protein